MKHERVQWQIANMCHYKNISPLISSIAGPHPEALEIMHYRGGEAAEIFDELNRGVRRALLYHNERVTNGLNSRTSSP